MRALLPRADEKGAWIRTAGLPWQLTLHIPHTSPDATNILVLRYSLWQNTHIAQSKNDEMERGKARKKGGKNGGRVGGKKGGREEREQRGRQAGWLKTPHTSH